MTIGERRNTDRPVNQDLRFVAQLFLHHSRSQMPPQTACPFHTPSSLHFWIRLLYACIPRLGAGVQHPPRKRITHITHWRERAALDWNHWASLSFVDYSSAFNTTLPSRLFHRMTILGLNHNICLWIMDFLTNQPQSVKLGPHHSSSLSLSTSAPQDVSWVASCTPYNRWHNSVCLISRGDETAYREKVQMLIDWCAVNNLTQNTKKTKELIIDSRRKKEDHQSLVINGEGVERVLTFEFLSTHISEDLTWTHNTNCLIRKAQQRLHVRRALRKVNLSQHLLVSFYHCSIESVLTYGMLVWYSSNSAAEKKTMQRIIKMVQKITYTHLPALTDITSCCLKSWKTHPTLPTICSIYCPSVFYLCE